MWDNFKRYNICKIIITGEERLEQKKYLEYNGQGFSKNC